jgi:hypothetical protein
VPKAVPLLAVAVATLGAAGLLSAASQSPAPEHGASYSVLQMNLCLSGLAGCYARTSYPSVVREAADQVLDRDPQAVTLNETCRGDAAEIARRTGYHLRFAAVRVADAPLPCVDPDGRGVFGLAVLTKDPISSASDHAFAVQAGSEGRRWMCAGTSRGVTVCTAHLDTRSSPQGLLANDLQCAELRAVLEWYDEDGATVFGGDVNRQEPCAPAGMWASEDSAAAQLPGIQHIYGSLTLGELDARVAAATYTDHDYFVADAALPRR